MENIAERIKKIRKLKNRSLHDCAKALDTPKERFHHFEEEDGVLSLPELELLAIFLEVPMQSLIQKSDMVLEEIALLSEEKMPVYKNLRDKMIQTKLNLEMESKGITLENLNQGTGISLETLKSYQENNQSIPYDHLSLICDQLEIPMTSLLQGEFESDQDVLKETTNEQAQWQSEFEDDSGNAEEETLYKEMLLGVKSLSIKDQAEIAKILLEKLKDS